MIMQFRLNQNSLISNIYIIFICSALTTGTASPQTNAQTKLTSGQLDGKLPTAIILAFRGPPGDKYQFKGQGKEVSSFHSGDSNISGNYEGSTKIEATEKVVAIGPKGLIGIEVSGQETESKALMSGKSKQISHPPFAALLTIKSNRERVKAEAISHSQSGSSTKRRAQPTSPASSSAQLRLSISFFGTIVFPTQLLHIGDEWSGILSVNPYETGVTKHLETYSAKLLSIELHRGIPCAKVEYQIKSTMRIPELEDQIEQALPPGARLVGGLSSNVHKTAYYSLDRGATIDIEIKQIDTVNYKVRLGGLEIPLEGERELEYSETTTLFPAYDPTLILKG